MVAQKMVIKRKQASAGMTGRAQNSERDSVAASRGPLHAFLFVKTQFPTRDSQPLFASPLFLALRQAEYPCLPTHAPPGVA